MRKTLILLTFCGALLGAPVASAHVTVNPNEVAADSFSRFAVRVPNERPNAQTTKIAVQLPEGLFFVSFQPKPGWKRTVTTQRLNPTVELFGEKQTERIATVTWTGGKIAPGEFDEFGLSAKVPNAPGRQLAFPAVQTYSNGEVVRWIGTPDSETPASRVTLGAKEPEAAAATAQPTAAATTTSSSDGDDDSNTATIALGFGIAGLVVGLAALGLVLFRRPKTA